MGIRRNSQEVLKREYGFTRVGTYIKEHTFLDCVLAEMSNSNSELTEFFKELDKRARKFGSVNFEEVSQEATKVMSEISKRADEFELARKIIKDSTGIDMSYKIDIEKNLIILTINDRSFNFTPELFNLNTIKYALESELYHLKTMQENCEGDLIVLGREIKALESQSERKMFSRKKEQKKLEKQKLYEQQTEKAEKLKEEIAAYEMIYSADSQYILTMYKAFIAVFEEYAYRRALRSLNKKGTAYIQGSYNQEDMVNALHEMVGEKNPNETDYCSLDERLTDVYEKGIRGEYDFNCVLPKYIENLRAIVEWYIDRVYKKTYSEEQTNGVSRKRTKKDNN